MTQWTAEELAALAGDENLYVSIANEDGTMHAPTWIWAAQAGDSLYSRGANGTDSRWYVSAKREGKGHIRSGGVEKDVTFEFPEDGSTLDAVDEGFKTKYAKYAGSYLEPVLTEKTRQATVRYVPVD